MQTMHEPVILVVEDNEIQQKVIRLLADEFGYKTVLTSSCTEALDVMEQSQEVSMILLDMRMPIIDGQECLGLIREKEAQRGKRTPVIAMTAHALSGDGEKYLSIGMDDYLAKPFSAAEFKAKVEQWFAETLKRPDKHSDPAEMPSDA
jgi:CheY-like chemotaxis protein